MELTESLQFVVEAECKELTEGFVRLSWSNDSTLLSNSDCSQTLCGLRSNTLQIRSKVKYIIKRYKLLLKAVV